MSLQNLEWYGWILLCVSINSIAHIVHLERSEQKEFNFFATAVVITLTLWMMTP